MNFFLYIIIGIGMIALVWEILKKRSTSDNGGKIASKYATFDEVKAYLEGFIPKTDPKLKNGYTEKSIENQLAKYLKQKFLEVKQQHGVEDVSARSIDIDVADGTAGIELKDAKKVVKLAEMDRMRTQLMVYQEKRYQDNLILLVVGDSEDKDDACLIKIRDFCRKKHVTYYFYGINKGLIE